MARNKTVREVAIRKYFGLANNAEVFYSRKAMAGPNGTKLSGWFLNENGVTKYLGSSADTSISSGLNTKTIVPPSL